MLTLDIQALRQRFVTEWADTPVFYDNSPLKDRKLDSPSVNFAVRPGASQHYTGNGEHGTKLQLGRVWLQIFVPAQTGDAHANSLIEKFASIFRNWRSDDGAVSCETEQLNAPMPDPTGMMMYSVSVPWNSIRSYT